MRDVKMIQDKIKIKKVTQTHVLELQTICKQTFFETFEGTCTEEDMDMYLTQSFGLGKLDEEITNENSQFYFACINNRTVGYLKINLCEAQTQIQDHPALEIERIYVLKEFHGKNVGQILYEKALQIATTLKVEYIWLGVWEKNSRAICFYKKNGFVEFGKHIFQLGNDPQTDMMMKLELNANKLE